jgi:methyltransferase-like protein
LNGLIIDNNSFEEYTSSYFAVYDTKKDFGGNLKFEILRNKKPEISATSGFDIVLYYYSKNVPNREALPP